MIVAVEWIRHLRYKLLSFNFLLPGCEKAFGDCLMLSRYLI